MTLKKNNFIKLFLFIPLPFLSYAILPATGRTVTIESIYDGIASEVIVDPSNNRLCTVGVPGTVSSDEFKIIDNNDGTYSFKSIKTGYYLCADYHFSPTRLVVDRPQIGIWEKFTIHHCGDFVFALKAYYGEWVQSNFEIIQVPFYFDAINSSLGGNCKFLIKLKMGVSAESVENYSGCNCNAVNLNYCNDQASKFINLMDDYHNRNFLYYDENAWNADIVEDQFGGKDHLYVDQSDFHLVSGHGSYDVDNSTYSGYLCPTSSWPFCQFNSTGMCLGEVQGQSYSYNPGNLKFLILCTCHSVEKDYYWNEWIDVFQRGKKMMCIMGFSGTSTDSENTDEVAEDFAAQVLGFDDWSLKQAWLWAIEDWWVNDMGAIVVGGTSQNDANANLESMKLRWEPTYNATTSLACAYHRG